MKHRLLLCMFMERVPKAKKPFYHFSVLFYRLSAESILAVKAMSLRKGCVQREPAGGMVYTQEKHSGKWLYHGKVRTVHLQAIFQNVAYGMHGVNMVRSSVSSEYPFP